MRAAVSRTQRFMHGVVFFVRSFLSSDTGREDSGTQRWKGATFFWRYRKIEYRFRRNNVVLLFRFAGCNVFRAVPHAVREIQLYCYYCGGIFLHHVAFFCAI